MSHFKMSKKTNPVLLALIMLVMFSMGCTNENDQFDTPEKVAKIFWSAIQNKDIETAKAQVHESVRSELGLALARDISGGNVPSFPKELKFRVEESGDTATAVILDSNGVGCDLILSNGRWWITINN